MAKNSLELLCEQYFIELFKTDTRLKGKTIRHSDSQSKAETNVIIVEAKQGNHRLDGPKGYDVAVTAEYRATGRSPRENDMVADAMTEVVYGASPGLTKAEAEFSWLQIMDDMTSDRSNGKVSRKRVRMFPLIAKAR